MSVEGGKAGEKERGRKAMKYTSLQPQVHSPQCPGFSQMENDCSWTQWSQGPDPKPFAR